MKVLRSKSLSDVTTSLEIVPNATLLISCCRCLTPEFLSECLLQRSADQKHFEVSKNYLMTLIVIVSLVTEVYTCHTQVFVSFL